MTMGDSLIPGEDTDTAPSFSVGTLEEVSQAEMSNEEERQLLPGFNRSCSLESIASKPTPETMIDNSNLTYIPMHLSCGVTVNCRPDVLTRCPQILQDLDVDLRQCLNILPKSIHNLVRKTNIWVNTTYYYGPHSNPHHVNYSTAHHHEAWLLSKLDRPEKAPGIEIYNCFEYRKMRWHWNGCGLLLHELCHVIHNVCLGLDNPVVEDAYKIARKSGKYDTTLRRDWAGSVEGDADMAYAMVDPKEFFAELSVAYWSQGYEQVVAKDSTSMRDSSPPFTAPEVISRLDPTAYPIADKTLLPKTSGLFRKILPPHCNKFYPFTRGQFQHMDPYQFEVFQKLWQEIADWQDDDDVECCGVRFPCWPFG
jgi:hypothetical protein